MFFVFCFCVFEDVYVRFHRCRFDVMRRIQSGLEEVSQNEEENEDNKEKENEDDEQTLKNQNGKKRVENIRIFYYSTWYNIWFYTCKVWILFTYRAGQKFSV